MGEISIGSIVLAKSMSSYSFAGDSLTGVSYGTPTDTSECCFLLPCRQRELPKSQVSFSLSDRWEMYQTGVFISFSLIEFEHIF